jgi:hypothetical protein
MASSSATFEFSRPAKAQLLAVGWNDLLATRSFWLWHLLADVLQVNFRSVYKWWIVCA